LPLGTGNDLARVFNWGATYAANESTTKYLAQVNHSQGVKLDRWKVTVDEIVDDKRVRVKDFVLSNYFSFGVDAKIALNFHNMRNAQPGLFSSQNVNKFWYITYGAQSMFENVLAGSADVTKVMEIEVDNIPLTLTEPFEGIVLVNLPSYAGGCNLWGGDKDDRFKPQSINDGLIEILGIRNVTHLVACQNGGLGVRLAQGRNIKIYHRHNQSSKKAKAKVNPMAFQIDGEPWEQKNPTIVEIKFQNQSSMLARYMVQ